jgi:hypothetical protein
MLFRVAVSHAHAMGMVMTGTSVNTMVLKLAASNIWIPKIALGAAGSVRRSAFLHQLLEVAKKYH